MTSKYLHRRATNRATNLATFPLLFLLLGIPAWTQPAPTAPPTPTPKAEAPPALPPTDAPDAAAPAQSPELNALDQRITTLQASLAKLTTDSPAHAATTAQLANLHQRRGVERFFAIRIPADAAASVADFDKVIARFPAEAPHHWQRGLALYYAGENKKGVEQFVEHQTVNGTDVENAAWHFLCLSRAENVDAARKAFYPFAGDRRIPMKEIHGLFAGTATKEDVLKAATAGPPERHRNQLCYAHLYLGLHHEAHGNSEQAAHHIKEAATTHRMDHYMGKCAQVHHRILQAGKKRRK